MGSDYSMAKIESWETINGIRVPIEQYGEYLNWREISEDGTEAKRLTDPYGVLMYGIGGESRDDGGDFTVWLDFAELPDGRVALDACWDSDSAGAIDEFAYEVVSRDEATGAAVALCDRAIDACFNNGVERGEDPYAFAREVAEHCGGTVPEGCEAPPWDELRVCDDDPENVTFELVFHNDHDSYISEVYGVEGGEHPADAAWAVCRRFGWDKSRPGDDDTSVRRVDHEDHEDPVRDGWIGSDGRP